MTPAEAHKIIDTIKTKPANKVRLRVVGSIDNPESEGPGAKLQTARKDAGLSVVQIADALKLRADQIAAIEAMNFAKLPGLGFALGYVRAYAELMDMNDVNSIVSDFRDAWAPIQHRNEKTHGEIDKRLVLPIGIVLFVALLAWVIFSATMHLMWNKPKDEIVRPDDAIKSWAMNNQVNSGKAVVEIDPIITIHALRDVRIVLRGQDGALITDKNLKAGENLPADGLGFFTISSHDAGAIEVRGYGLSVIAGGNHEKIDYWRAPDLKLMADAKAKAEQEALALKQAEEEKKAAKKPENSLPVTKTIGPPELQAPQVTESNVQTLPPNNGQSLQQ